MQLASFRTAGTVALLSILSAAPAHAQDGVASVRLTYNGEVILDVAQFDYGLPALASATDPDGDQWDFAFTVRLDDPDSRFAHQIVLEFATFSGGESDIEPFVLEVAGLDERGPIRAVVVANAPIDLDVETTETTVTIANTSSQAVAAGESNLILARLLPPR